MTADQAHATDDQERLTALVDIWWRAVDDLTRLLEELPPQAWALPTDLPGWDVHAVAAHTAHLEAILAGQPEETLAFEPPPHATTLMQHYTEQGVQARRDRSPDELINEIRTSATARRTTLAADPPRDATAIAPRIFGGLPWTWERLLRNRPLDVWMHEQDIRRAVGRPGNLDSPAAQHTTDYLLESMGMVLAKRAGAPPGTSLVVAVEGSTPVGFTVGTDGRAEPLSALPAAPTVRLRTDRETFVLAAGGRRPPEPGAVQVDGDPELSAAILAHLAVTP